MLKWHYFYAKYFGDLQDRAKQNVKCIFHDDREPSLSLDLETGLFYCHACNAGGDVFSFYMKHHACSFSKAKQDVLGNEKMPYLTGTEVSVAHANLLGSHTIQQMLLIKRGWSLGTIKQLQLGWKDERVFIPIYENDKLANIRKYDVLHKSKHKFVGIEGYNSVHLWPEKSLQYDWVAIFAGEPDTILALQLGMPAITFTGGEGTFNAGLLPQFTNKKVYIVYDPDSAGRFGAEKLSQAILKYTKDVYNVRLPEKTGDFTDLFLHCTDNNVPFIDVWNPLIEQAILCEPKKEEERKQATEVDFYSAVHDECYGKDISFKAIAIGKNFSPYFAPKKVKAKCSFSRGDSCKTCKMFFVGGETEIEITEEHLLDLIKCANNVQMDKLKHLLGIHGCAQFKLEIETQNIEEIFITPIIDTEKIDRQFLIRKCYAMGHNLGLNKTYKFTGKTIPDAKTQEATHLFYEAKPELTDLDKFTLSEDDIKQLRVFQPISDSVEGVKAKMSTIHADITYNVPEIIIGRELLMLAYDLVFHSVLKFKFLQSTVSKGWAELIVLGDTRTGKTKTALKMCKHYRLGEYITLESATLPGLVGGMSQVGRDITFSWGVLPINDGRLAILDEVNGLQTKDISNLSSIRDNGIAERTVVGSTRKTSARVRLVWISNPRSMNTNISHYSSGIEAIRELIGRAEDISRFDFAMIVAKEDVDLLEINRGTQKHVEHVYTSDLCNKCVMWAWSRKEEHVTFTKEAEIAILDHAIDMANKYSDSIPLVQGSVQRIKLAKLAVAVACRLFSTSDGINVIVKKEHVDFVALFLAYIYCGPYFGYSDYSQQRTEEGIIADSDKIKEQVMALPSNFIDKMLDTNTILFDDIKDFSGLSREAAGDLKARLVSNNCIKRKKTFFVKTPEFIKILKQAKVERANKKSTEKGGML